MIVADPHGRVALLLIESLIHGLIARSALTAQEALEVVETALEVQKDPDSERMSAPDTHREAVRLLTEISNSLSIDATR